MRESAAFTMLAGSEIRGNTNSGNAVANDVGATVYVVSGSSFTMLGGSITGNHSTTAENTARGGGLFASGVGTVIALAGGNITGNTAVWGGDMFVMDNVASFTLSGTASVGTVGLHAANVARIPLGDFVSATTTEAGRQPIAPTHHINASGVLVVNAP